MYGFGSDKISDLGLSAIRKITDLWKGSMSDSLIDYTQVARVEPIVLIDTDCLYLESLGDIQQSLLSIFAGYYLQAVAISTSIGKIEVMRHLDKLNPRRSPGDSAANSMGWLLAQESYKHALPTFEKREIVKAIGLEAKNSTGDLSDAEAGTIYRRQTDDSHRKFILDRDQNAEINRLKAADTAEQIRQWTEERADRLTKDGLDRAEAATAAKLTADKFEHDKMKYGEEKALANLKLDLEREGLKLRKDERNDKLTASEVGFGRDTMKDLKELANLSVGKMFSVEITDGLHKASIMVSIRLMASSLPSANLVHILSVGSKDNSAKERYHAWKAGRLEFIKDLCFCQDLIDAHRKNLMADKDGIYTNLLKRARSNALSTILSGNPSVATASNIVIISNTTADRLQVETNLKLSNHHDRERIMKDTYLMILVVVDAEWNRVTIYHRGINMASELSLKDLKAANSKEGISVSEVLKAYSVGQGPSL